VTGARCRLLASNNPLRVRRPHPSVTLLFGVLGATLTAPITAVALRTINLLRDTGLFGVLTTRSATRATTDRRALEYICASGHDPAIGGFARRLRTALRATLEMSDAMVAPMAT
jgi:hypothetical protein